MFPAQTNEFKIVDGYVITQKLLGRVSLFLFQGSFGTVYRGFHEKDPKKLVAAKVLPLSQATKTKNFMKSLKREIEILTRIDNPYIVKLLHAARTQNNYYIFLEYCNGNDLRHLIKQKGYLSESESLTYFRQIVGGFKGIYQENVIHRDIKPANIMLHDGIAKISDFGFARVVDDMEDVDLFTMLGTPLYMAPQILSHKEFSAKCDIWSLGMMFYEMLYGHTPWVANSQLALLDQINKNEIKFPEQPQRSQVIKDLIVRMLKINEADRISWFELFDHELIKFDDTALKQKVMMISSNNDTLEQSVQINQLYVDNNKVLAQGQQQVIVLNNADIDNDPIQQSDPFSGTGDTFKPDMTYNEILDAQTNKLMQQDNVNKIDAILTYRRNIGIFVNLTTNNVFQLYKEGKIKIELHLFYRIIFILQKYQMIIFEELTNIMASKIPIGQGYTDVDWKNYKRSQQYFTTLHAIKADKSHIKPYYNEIQKRTISYLDQQMNGLKAQEKEEIKEFQFVLNVGLQQDMQFFTVYNRTIQSVLKAMSPIQERLFATTARYLHICIDPFRYFDKVTYDFNKFYENYENLPVQTILAETNGTEKH